MARLLQKNWLRLILVFIIAFALSLTAGLIIKAKLAEKQTEEKENTSEEEPEPEEEVPQIPEFIDLQPVVDAWLATVNGDVGLVFYDFDNQRVAAEYQPNVVFNSASVYKLFFAYDGYQQIDAGVDDGDEYFTTTYDKGALTLGQCLDLIIRESYNGCADPLRADSTRFARAEALATRLGLIKTSSAGLYSTAADLTELMKLYWQHPDLSEASWEAILDSMLNQPKTTYDWRRGFPSGFNQALVYDKVGWDYTGSYWRVYNDVSFVVFPTVNRHYIMTILTSDFVTYDPITALGSQVEAAILEQS